MRRSLVCFASSLLLAAQLQAATAAPKCPDADPIEMSRKADSAGLEAWALCRVRCATDADCMDIEDECGARRYVNKAYQKDWKRYIADLKPRVECTRFDTGTTPTWPKSRCVAQQCQPEGTAK